MSFGRQALRAPFVRQLGVLLALATVVVAVYASVDAVVQHRAAVSSARVARDYAGIGFAAGRQQQLLAGRGGAAVAQRLQRNGRLTRQVELLLADLRARTRGDDRTRVAALARTYAAAAQAAALALRTPVGSARKERRRHATARLAEVRAGATGGLKVLQSTALRSPASSTVAIAKLASPALTASVALVLLCVAPLRRRRLRAPLDSDRVRLEAAARTDSLTGLGNHRAFHHDLSAEVQRRSATGSSFVLMAIDLDGLKQINDTGGHQAGDRYIKQVCEILVRTTAGVGTLYRTGGDEFMVLLPGKRNWDALELAHKIDEATRAALGRRGLSIGLTESLGSEARHLLIHQADLALYEAKRTKLTAVTYQPGMTSPLEVAVDAPSHHQKALAAALARAVDAKDVGTRSHSETVAELCVGIGRRLGMEGEALERLRFAGLLHDVGKIGVADVILRKPAALATQEQDEMREHVSIGHAILLAAELTVEAEWVLHHHERADGTGYPARLRGDEIPLQSRIIAVADAFEAMTGSRPYRASVTTAQALAELTAHSGTQFDTRCVHALIETVDEEAAAAAVAALDPRRARRDVSPALSAPELATT